jgi:hypothetical protein
VKLFEKAPDDLDDAYVEALVDGLTESDAPREWTFDAIRRFGFQDRPETRRLFSWSLTRIADNGTPLPQDLVDLLSLWIRLPAGKDEAHWEQQSLDLSDASYNTDRGAAFRAVMSALSIDDASENTDARWDWIEFVSEDPSVVLRAGALMALVDLLRFDQERAIKLFERLVDGFPQLRDANYFHEFIYTAIFGHFGRLAPYIKEVMNAPGEQTRRRGAELAVIGQISPLSLEDDSARELARALTEEAIGGAAEWRRGAAHVFASNLVNGPTDLCVAGLHRLINDEDAEVRQLAVGMIHELREDDTRQIKDFLLSLASSWAIMESLDDFSEYLWKCSDLDPEWTLGVVKAILANPNPTPEHSGFYAGEHLIRTVLRIYTDPVADQTLRRQAMDLFDQLMSNFSGAAWEALNEWDRL